MRFAISCVLLSTALAACGENDVGPTATDNNRMTATINGQAFQGAIVNGYIARGSDGRQVLTMTALESCSSGWSLNMFAQRPERQPFAVGTYTVGLSFIPISPGVSEGFTEFSASAARVSENAYWDAPRSSPPPGTGTLRVTSLSNTQVEGTFDFSAPPRPGGAATGNVTVTNGAFRITLEEKRIC